MWRDRIGGYRFSQISYLSCQILIRSDAPKAPVPIHLSESIWAVWSKSDGWKERRGNRPGARVPMTISGETTARWWTPKIFRWPLDDGDGTMVCAWMRWRRWCDRQGQLLPAAEGKHGWTRRALRWPSGLELELGLLRLGTKENHEELRQSKGGGGRPKGGGDFTSGSRNRRILSSGTVSCDDQICWIADDS
jgi:hypothetical protein